MWEFRKYQPCDAPVWDTFVASSRNGTFLLKRPFMDYHQERFADHSLMAYRNGKLLGLLPANIQDGTLCSHGGLTYGGWILPLGHVSGADVLTLFEEMKSWLSGQGISRLLYKCIPAIYHRLPSQDDEYALWRLEARKIACGLSSATDLSLPVRFSLLQRRMVNKASKHHLCARRLSMEELPEFWNLLAECLASRHGVTPVHSLGELQTLTERFPDNIICWGIGDPLMAATCLFVTDMAVHAQYICASEQGRSIGALPKLFHFLLSSANRLWPSARYFDFGISTEDHGKLLNEGLNSQKSAFGSGGVLYNQYSLDL